MPDQRICRAAIDRSYAQFLAALPPKLQPAARRLSHRLGFATRAGMSWGEVFEDAPVLGLPCLLLSKSSLAVSEDIRECALRAHLFAMLSAQVSARLDVEPDAELESILFALERERNRSLAELRILGADRNVSFSSAERETRSARSDEREVLEGRVPASLATYVMISTAKQSMSFPAAMAGALAAKFDTDALGHVHEVVLGVMLGMQIRDDVQAWLQDPHTTRSWVAALVGDGSQRDVATVIDEMLERAGAAFYKAAKSASALGSSTLMRWARREANAIRALQRRAHDHVVPALAV